MFEGQLFTKVVQGTGYSVPGHQGAHLVAPSSRKSHCYCGKLSFGATPPIGRTLTTPRSQLIQLGHCKQCQVDTRDHFWVLQIVVSHAASPRKAVATRHCPFSWEKEIYVYLINSLIIFLQPYPQCRPALIIPLECSNSLIAKLCIFFPVFTANSSFHSLNTPSDFPLCVQQQGPSIPECPLLTMPKPLTVWTTTN